MRRRFDGRWLMSVLAVFFVLSLVWGGSLPGERIAADGDDDRVLWMWTLPDDDAGAPGTQVLPVPDGSQEMSWWAMVRSGSPAVESVAFDIYYPDGAVRGRVAAQPVTDTSLSEAAIDGALDAGLITQAQVDTFRSGTVSAYVASDEFATAENAGHYRVETRVTLEGQTEELAFVNSFEYVRLVAHEYDFDSIFFGSASPGSTLHAFGQYQSGSPSSSMVTNAGNVPALLEVTGTAMIGADFGDTITDFGVGFLGQDLPFSPGTPAAFDEPLMVGESGTISFALYVPADVSADTYNGDLTIAVNALPGPTVEVLSPAAEDTWSLGDARTIAWEAHSANGSDDAGLLISIWLSPDGGNAWILQIAENVANTGSYDWSIPWDDDLASAQAVIRVVAIDPDTGCYGVGESEAFLMPPPTV